LSRGDDELRAVWRAADALGKPSGPFIKMLMLTGQRRDEVRCMSWREIDEKAGVWTLPAARNKRKRVMRFLSRPPPPRSSTLSRRSASMSSPSPGRSPTRAPSA
jgi:hypothetical protein